MTYLRAAIPGSPTPRRRQDVTSSVVHHNWLPRIAAAVLACAVIALCGVRAEAADPALVAAAEAEGQLVVYGGDISETPHQIKRFMEVYPKIKATSVTAGGWQLYNRYMSEHAAGQAVADAFTNVEDTLLTLDANGHLAEFRSEAVKNFPPGTQDGNFVRTKLGYAALVTNTEQMKGQPVPDDWTSFAAPPKAWEDRIAYVDPRGSSVAFMVLAALSQNYGEEKTRKIYEGLKSMRSEVSMNTPASVAKVVSGERPLMMYILTNHVGDALRKGAPLSFKIPASGAVPFYFTAGVLKNARHPNAARLYIEFLLDQGQDVIISRGEYALRNGAPAPQGLLPLDQVKLMPIDLKKALAEQKKLIAWWQDVTGIQ
jgi:iron(III) transport system substrate-binding protein